MLFLYLKKQKEKTSEEKNCHPCFSIKLIKGEN